MKRFLCVLLCLAMMLGLVGCSQEHKVESMVDTFCKAMQAFDLATIQSCIAESQLNAEFELEGSFELSLQEVMKEYADQIEYEICSSTVEKENAQVVVKFSYRDASPVVTGAIAEFMSQALLLALGGADDQMLSDAFAGILLEKKDTIETYACEETVTFDCMYLDGEWKIAQVDDDVLNILTSNILTTMEEFADSDENTQDSDTTEDFIWNNVPMGTPVELATIKVTVTDCAETYAIRTDDHDYEANEGTKYIVFSVKVENITNEPLYLDSDTFPLYDSNSRHYDPYDDVTWYMDNIIYTPKFSPNIPVEGIIVYNVPKDSAGYYFEIRKGDTNNIYRFYGAENISILPEISYVEETEPTQSGIDTYEEDESHIEAYVKYGIGGGLNIRSGPGTDNETVGRLSEGEMVLIWETQYVGNTQWGRIDQGWISMDYIQFDVPTPPSYQESNSASTETYETDFFYITLPAGWEEKYALEHSYSARSENLVFYYASEYEYYQGTYSEPGGWPFAIEVRADGTDCSAIAGWEHIGSINVFEDSWYELYLHYPMDPQFMDGSYNSFLADAQSIVDSIVAKDGYTITMS